MGSKWQPRARAVVGVFPHWGGCEGAGLEWCSGHGRKGRLVLKLTIEMDRIERAIVVRMIEMTLMNVILWHAVGIFLLLLCASSLAICVLGRSGG